MVKYSCIRCGYECNIKTHLLQHYRRKKTCSNVLNGPEIEECIKLLYSTNNRNHNFSDLNALEMRWKCVGVRSYALEMRSNGSNLSEKEGVLTPKFACTICAKTFKCQRYLYQHLKRYNCKEKMVTKDIDYLPPELKALKEELRKDMVNEYKAVVDSKNEIIRILRDEIGRLLKEKGNTYTTNNLVIQPFGQENTGYISNDYISNLVQIAPIKSIPNLLEYIHFNPEHIENQNVKIPNTKKSFIHVYDGKKWAYKDKSETIENMTDKAYGIINEHYGQGSNKYMDDINKKIGEKDKGILKRLLKDTEAMILNNQGKIVKK